jgi:3-deoxy-manno-octulosonate cytidylyltransferase (CMP-KDO synthetase)
VRLIDPDLESLEAGPKRATSLVRRGLALAAPAEQLRVLENGFSIACDLTEDPTIGVDTPEDGEKFERWLG